MKEWPDEWKIVSNDLGVWVKHVPSNTGWKVTSDISLRQKEDLLAQTYQRLHETD